MPKSMTTFAAAGLAMLALGVAGCGGSSSSNSTTSQSSSPATSQPASSTTSTAASHAAKKSSKSSSSSIPQGPSAGDQDADNNGGPSDGDGNI